MFPPGFTCPVVLSCANYFRFRLRDFYSLWYSFPEVSANYFRLMHGRALSISLAATLDIEFSFFSSGYLDVSVHPVRFYKLCIHL